MHWWPKHGKSMDTFRTDLTKMLAETTPVAPPAPAEEMYRVRKSWEDSKTQEGAYKVLENAKDAADANAEYKVYNSTGQLVYDPAAPKPEDEIRQLKSENATLKAEIVHLDLEIEGCKATIDASREILETMKKALMEIQASTKEMAEALNKAIDAVFKE